MNISRVSNCSFKGVYLSTGLNPGKQYELGKQMREVLNKSGLADDYEKKNKDILINPVSENSVKISVVRHDIKRILDDNYDRWNGKF